MRAIDFKSIIVPIKDDVKRSEVENVNTQSPTPKPRNQIFHRIPSAPKKIKAAGNRFNVTVRKLHFLPI